MGRPVPARGSAFLAVGLPPPPRRWWTVAGLPRSTRMRCDRVGCQLYPGSNGVHTTSNSARSPPADSQRPAPYHPHHHVPTRGADITRHQRWFTGVHPLDLPLTCDPRTERVSLGFPLGFAPGHYWPRTPGRGPVLDTDRSHVFDIESNLQSTDYSQRATSCRNYPRHDRTGSATITARPHP